MNSYLKHALSAFRAMMSSLRLPIHIALPAEFDLIYLHIGWRFL